MPSAYITAPDAFDRLKAEAERLAAERTELARLKAEQEKAAAAERAELDEQRRKQEAAAAAERAKIDAERNAGWRRLARTRPRRLARQSERRRRPGSGS